MISKFIIFYHLKLCIFLSYQRGCHFSLQVFGRRNKYLNVTLFSCIKYLPHSDRCVFGFVSHKIFVEVYGVFLMKYLHCPGGCMLGLRLGRRQGMSNSVSECGRAISNL